MSNKTYRLYPKAIENLESIYLYTTREFGTQKAKHYISVIETSFPYLVDNPLIARKCDYIHQNLRAFNVGSHVIFLKVTDCDIVVIPILHQSMDFIRHL